MNSDYQKGRNAVQDAKDKASNVAQKAGEYAEGAKDKAKETWQDTKEKVQEKSQGSGEYSQGVWDKTKEVASDIKDSIANTASTVYEKAKDMVSSSDDQNKNLQSGTNKNIK
jgi:ElaB/YqjD/DUF883 family membrane-anchored ribosome-binding protein